METANVTQLGSVDCIWAVSPQILKICEQVGDERWAGEEDAEDAGVEARTDVGIEVESLDKS